MPQMPGLLMIKKLTARLSSGPNVANNRQKYSRVKASSSGETRTGPMKFDVGAAPRT